PPAGPEDEFPRRRCSARPARCPSARPGAFRGFICQTGNMATPLQITAVSPDPALFDLPWQIPLEEWPEDILAAFPRGISRHVVRLVRVSGRVLAIKAIGEPVAFREAALLRGLRRLEPPSVTPVGVITGRLDPQGRPLGSVPITKRPKCSLPCRLWFSRRLAPNMATRLIDALTVLLVRLHLS